MTAAGSPPTADSAAAFVAALGRTESPFRYAVVNQAALGNDCRAALQAGIRLRAYYDFLTQARAYKASGAAAADGVAAQVLAQAHDALSDFRAVSTSALRVTGSLAQGGALSQLLQSFRQAVAAAGSVSTLDLWKQVTAPGPGRDAILALGIDDASFAMLDQSVSAVDVHVTADGNQLLVSGEMNGETVNGSLMTVPRPANPTSVADLLTRGRFDALSAAFQDGEPAYLQGVALVPDGAYADDVALCGALTAYEEGLRHVRKLEDTGLATYTGAGWVTVLVIVGVSLGVVGGLMMLGNCGETGEKAQSNCSFGQALFYIGTAILAILLLLQASATAKQMQGSADLVLGSVVIHGVLQDFQVSAVAG
jgi:hypothetical protein